MKKTQNLRVVIVTGGSGALGRAVVSRFLEGGDRVVVPWILKAERDAIEAEEGAALQSGRLVLVEADLSEESGARIAANALPDAEVLVNGVGGFLGGPPVLETELEVWDRMFRMNVRTAVAMSRAVLPGMLARGRGAIVNIASRAAFDRPAGLAAYASAKAAIVVLTETLQREVQAQGLRVNAVVPTTIDTPANRAAMPGADFSLWTPPARIADVIHWLASDASGSVRGALVPV
jgi:NAD(P)-dependent dehydrogenase (short-subunit alcohol dehydrogenase family)